MTHGRDNWWYDISLTNIILLVIVETDGILMSISLILLRIFYLYIHIPFYNMMLSTHNQRTLSTLLRRKKLLLPLLLYSHKATSIRYSTVSLIEICSSYQDTCWSDPFLSFNSVDTYHNSIRRLAQELLDQKLQILSTISDKDYVKNCPAIFNASIASHIRHSLNHFQSLLKAHDQSIVCIDSESTLNSINYDERERNTEIETSRLAALTAIQEISGLIPELSLSKNINMSFYGTASTNFEPYSVSSNVARELSFVTHHGVHHMAMIKLIIKELGYSSDDTIGMAMSTIKYQRALKDDEKKL